MFNDDKYSLQKKLHHSLSESKNVVRYIEHFRILDKLYIVTQLMNEGSLLEFMQK